VSDAGPTYSNPVVERWADSPPARLEVSPPPAKFRDRRWLHLLLLVLTALTTMLVGLGHYAAFLSELGARTVTAGWSSLGYGAWYSATILAILGAHEMGHYVACRYYRVDASLPYFIPAVGVLTGTFGAVIRIREPILYKRALFDIGIAGPIAGFVVAVPALFLGLALSNVVPLPRGFQGLELGEPLLFKAASWLVWGTPAQGLTVNIHPMAFAAWFGLLATALNLFPIAQLDGGHISYAVLGRRSTYVSYGALLCAAALTLVSLSWLVWTVMIVAMLFVAGPRHPPVMDELVPLDRTRQWLALFAIVIFALCFTPAPIELLDLVPR
jgi:membrane-associated protease RseP (regulator of RpoE activity)